MPYELREIKGKWHVWNTEKNEDRGASDSKAQAVAHMRLLYGVEGGMKPWSDKKGAKK